MHTLILENTHGQHVVVMENVSGLEVVAAFDKLVTRAAHMAQPIIFVDGVGYTNRSHFMEMVRDVNRCSLNAGGDVVFA